MKTLLKIRSGSRKLQLAICKNRPSGLLISSIFAIALSISFLISACGKQEKTPVATNASYTNTDQTGQLALTLQWEGQNKERKFAAPAGVATIRIIITATGMNTVSQDFTASLGGGSITGVLAGTNRTVTAYGLDASGYIKYDGSLSGVNIAAGETTTVAIVLIAQLQSVAPTATITADSTTGNAPLNVTFTVGYTDPENTSGNYSLDFGDGTAASTGTLASAATAQVSHSYNNSGNYTATLTVTDAHGTVGTANVGVGVTSSNVTISGWVRQNRPTYYGGGFGIGFNGNYIFAANGWNNYSFLYNIQSAQILPNGEVSTWTAQPNTLNNPSDIQEIFFSSVNDRIYITGGGYAGCYAKNDVQSSTLSGGTIGSWSYITNLTNPVRGSQVYVINNRVYIIGDVSTGAECNNGPYSSLILKGEFQPGGDISWTTLNVIDYPRIAPVGVVSWVYNNAIYVMTFNPGNGPFSDAYGQCTSSSDCTNHNYKLVKLNIQPDGSLIREDLPGQLQDLPKSDDPNNLYGLRGEWRVIVWNNNVIFVGKKISTDTYLRVLAAPILSPTSFGPVYEILSAQLGTDVKITNCCQDAFLYGNYLYVFGSDDATGAPNRIPEVYSAKLSLTP